MKIRTSFSLTRFGLGAFFARWEVHSSNNGRGRSYRTLRVGSDYHLSIYFGPILFAVTVTRRFAEPVIVLKAAS